MSFPSFSVLRQWRASLRADSPPPPLLQPSSLHVHSHHTSPYLDDLDPQPSEPSTPLPQDDFSYNDASVTLHPFTPAPPTTSATDSTTPGSFSLSSILRSAPVPVRGQSASTTRGLLDDSDASPPPAVLLATPAPSPAPLPQAPSLTPIIGIADVSAVGFLPLQPATPGSPTAVAVAEPARLQPPALQASLILAHCRAWLLATEEYEVRARLNLTASDKHALKVRLHQALQRFQAEDRKMTAALEALQAQEEALRKDLDALTGHISRASHRHRKQHALPPHSSPTPSSPSSSAAAVTALRDQRQALWTSLEALIHRRNAQRSALLTVQQSVSCMTQALYQTHIFLREQYTQFTSADQPAPAIDTTTIDETPVKRPADASTQPSPGSRISLTRKTASQPGSLLGSPQAPSSPREGALSAAAGVRFVSSVDEWVLSSVNRLGVLRATEGRLQKRLDKLTVSRSQIQSYFERITAYTKRQAASGRDGGRRSDGEPPQTLSLLARGLRQLSAAAADADAGERLDAEQLTALVYEHRNRKILHRVLETIESSGLLTSRRVGKDVHGQAIVGAELVLWFVKSNLLPSAVDAVELIDLLCRAGLLVAVGGAAAGAPASAGSFASGGLREATFVLAARAPGCGWDDLTKSGWMEKVGRYRSYGRYFVWDTDLRRLAYYESSKDAQPMRVYWVDHTTSVHALDGRHQAQLHHSSAASTPSEGRGGGGGKAHFEVVFKAQQHGESSLLLAVRSDDERREWMRVLALGLAQADSSATREQRVAQRKRDSLSGTDLHSLGVMRAAALPPSLSFSTDSSLFPSLALPVDPHSFTQSTRGAPGSPSSPSSPTGASPMERSREALRLSEFSVSRAKSALMLQSAISHVEAKAELDLGLVEILNDVDDDEDEQPGMQSTPVKPRPPRPSVPITAQAEADEDADVDAYEFEEEDDEDDAEDDAADEDDDIIPGQLASPSRADPSDAYTALRKAQRRRKTLRAIDRLTVIIREESSALGRLLSVFVKLFRSLYSHALDVEAEAGKASATALPTPVGSLYSSSSFSFTPYGGAAASAGGGGGMARARSVMVERATPHSSPLASPTASAAPSGSPSVPSTPSSVSSTSRGGRFAYPAAAAPAAAEYYSMYPRHVRHVLRSAKEDIDTFLQQLLRLISAHLQPDPFTSDPALQSLLTAPTAYVPSALYIAGAKANSVLSPTPSLHAPPASSTTPSPAVLLAHKNRDVQSIVRACHRVLARHVHHSVSVALLPVYEVKWADRDREADERMRALTDVRWEELGLSAELLLPGMKRSPIPASPAGEEREGKKGLADEFNALHDDSDEGAQPASTDAESSFTLPPLELSVSASPSTAAPAVPPYHHALTALSWLSAVSDPYDKLSCVLRVARAICRSVDEAHSRQAVVINADDLLLLFAYLLISATASSSPSTTPRWHAHLSLMSDYTTDKQRCMLRGYYLATMQAALELVMTGDLGGGGGRGRGGAMAEVADGELSALESASSESLSSVGSAVSAGSGEVGGTPEEDMGELVVIVQ